GAFANVFPIGIDAGICVLLALDLLLTWIRIPFPLLRQTAWMLTAATIAFNGAAAWPDPIGVGMHGVIPVLFVVSVEAARHAIGRIADITADRHMESVRIARWLLAPIPTFRLWRRMKLWELRSYDEVIRLEQDRLVYQTRLQARYGRQWRRKAPVEALMPLRLARYGVPLSDTAPAGLEAAGLEPSAFSPAAALPRGRATAQEVTGEAARQPGHETAYQTPGANSSSHPNGPVMDPAGQRPQALQLTLPQPNMGVAQSAYVPEQRDQEQPYVEHGHPGQRAAAAMPDDVSRDEVFYAAYRQYLADNGRFPSAYQFGQRLRETYGVADLSNDELTGYVNHYKDRSRGTTDEGSATPLPPAHEQGRELVGAGRARPLGPQRTMNGHDHGTAVPRQRGRAPEPDHEGPSGASYSDGPQRARPGAHPLGDTSRPNLANSGATPPAEPLLPAAPADEHGASGPGRGPAEPQEAAEPGHIPQKQSPAAGTVADRYYTAWRSYREEHGAPPNGEQLSEWLHARGVTGRNGKAVSPSTLRRYISSYPCYEVWAEHAETYGQELTAEELEQLLADRGLMRNNGGTAWTVGDLERLLPDFQRRRQLGLSTD
ncbi:DUF2637 domain-containing protein, partial [Streptomyces sp. BRA346]